MHMTKHLMAIIIAAALGMAPAAAETPARAFWSQPTYLSAPTQDAADLVMAGTDSGERAVAVWTRSDGSKRRVQASTTADGATTWRAPRTLSASRQDGELPHVAMAASAEHILTAWSRRDAVTHRLQAVVSPNGGVTWNPVKTLSSGTGAARNARVAVSDDGQRMVVAWEQSDGTNIRIMTAVSADAGLTWSMPTAVSPAGRDALRVRLAMARAGDRLLASWTAGSGAARSVQAAVSTDGGATFAAPATLSTPGRNAGSSQVSTSADGSRMAAVWTQDTPGGTTLQTSYTADAGETWNPAATLVAACEQAPRAVIEQSADGRTVWVAVNNGCEGVRAIQVTVSADAAATWSPLRTLSGTLTLQDHDPSLTVSSDATRAAVGWGHDEQAPGTMRVAVSADTGASWTTQTVAAGGGGPLVSSADGTRLIAGLTGNDGSNWRIQTSHAGLATVPDAPAGVDATPGDGQATLTWQPPAHDGGSPVMSYSVTSSPGGLSCSTTEPTCTLTGLTNGTAYRFTVTATNAVGTGPASAAFGPVTPQAPTPKPTPQPKPKPPQTTIRVKAAAAQTKLRVRIGPDRGADVQWYFAIQRQKAAKWRTLDPPRRTRGPKHTQLLDLPKGTYRVVVRPPTGYAAATSAPVRLLR